MEWNDNIVITDLCKFFFISFPFVFASDINTKHCFDIYDVLMGTWLSLRNSLCMEDKCDTIVDF